MIRKARAAGLVTKSNLILGMGETPEEVTAALRRPARGGLRHPHDHPVPAARSLRHHPVERWVKPEEFVEHRDEAHEHRASPA